MLCDLAVTLKLEHEVILLIKIISMVGIKKYHNFKKCILRPILVVSSGYAGKGEALELYSTK